MRAEDDLSEVAPNAVAEAEAGDLERLEVTLIPGARVLVCGGLHLTATPTEAAALVTGELIDRLARWSGPGVVVLNGECFELDAEVTIDAVLAAHPAWQGEILRFAEHAGRQVVVAVGSTEATLVHDRAGVESIERLLGAPVVESVDLLFESDRETSVVRVEPGHHFDPFGTSLAGRGASGAARPFMASSRPADGSYLVDADTLADARDFPRFLGSRLVYREVAGRLAWLAVPVLVVLVALRAPLLAGLVTGRLGDHRMVRWAIVGSFGLVADVALLALLALVLMRRMFQALAVGPSAGVAVHPNEPSRVAAESLCAQGFAGYVTGHTSRPELTPLRTGFYANAGCGTRTTEARPAHGRLPPVFAAVLRRSWVELESVRGQVRAEMIVAETDAGDRSRIERLASKRRPLRPATPTVVATVPGSAGWPIDHAGLRSGPRRDRHRRLAAGLVLVAVLVNVLSAVTPPEQGRLRSLLELFPVEVSQTASAALVFASLALLVLARGLRRGQRMAWLATVGILAATAVLHLAKGVDVEEALLAGVIAAWIGAYAADFRVRPDLARVKRAIIIAVAGAGLAVVAAFAIVVAVGDHPRSDTSVRALAERLGGKRTIPLPGGTPFVTPALTATGIGLALVVALLVFGPRRPSRPSAEEREANLVEARRIVAHHGGDTLAYFALRSDKDFFFTGSSMVAYAVRNGVCLVSPDPIGPPEEWEDTWVEFADFADRNGWPVAVVAAQPAWLPIYEAAGMKAVYMGDEAIVNCQTFTLAGGDMKSLRGGYNRVRKAGYRTIFVDPATVEPDLAEGLRALMTQTRHGETERGFSMTLSRIFDPADVGLLLSVAVDDEGRPAAFCHWAPAADIDGWSLDLMRRGSDPSLPNGLTDFVVIDTIEHLKANGQMGLGLNFAVMREIVAGERDGSVAGLERRILHKFSDSMQIESLWRYNEKYRPYWRPRYAVLDAVEHTAAHGIAIVDAEGVSELPLIGRFLGRQPV